MDYSGWCERGVASRERLRVIAHLNFTTAFEDQVQLVLSLMRVSRVLLAWLERVQPGEQELALGQSALAHFLRRELRQARDLLQKHTRHSNNHRPVPITALCVRT